MAAQFTAELPILRVITDKSDGLIIDYEGSVMPTASVYGSLFEPWRRAMRMTTLLTDSMHVVTVRARKIGEASANPLKADYAELNRMVPEKVEAFSEAAISLSSDLAALQSNILGAWNEIMGLALRSRLPTQLEVRQIADRSSTIAAHFVRVGDKALIPIEKKARSNAKRLK